MRYRKISQKEARRLQRRVAELEELRRKERSEYTREYPNGIHLLNWEPNAWVFASVKTARRLGAPVMVTHDPDDKTLHFYAVKEA